jgi:anthranilate synthase component 1|tara:strand:- start:4016 stop:5518 length:1503 start_codon:yes stop_codon:yes gene_type:complete
MNMPNDNSSGTNLYYPTLDDVLALSDPYTVVPIFREVRADLETPVSAYLKVAQDREYAFLLESVEGGERQGRYSFIGTDPYKVVSSETESGDPLLAIQDELTQWRAAPVEDLPKFHGGAVGYLAYECVTHFESRVESNKPFIIAMPDSKVMFIKNLLVFDHVRNTIKVVSHVRLEGDRHSNYAEAVSEIDHLIQNLTVPLGNLPYSPSSVISDSPVEQNWSKNEFIDAVGQAKQYIIDGDVIQVVLSMRLSKNTGVPPFEVYRSLRAINPSPYLFFLRFEDTYVVGSSPELLVNIEDGLVEVHPIAGTRPRGSSKAEDAKLAEELSNDPKELAEHVMLLDLGRNDVGRVAKPGSVQVTQQFDVEYYSHVMHLVSHVTGELQEDITAYDALRSAFPAGTVSGAPKVRAMEIINELEPDRRGLYSGAVGFFDMSGNIETCIAIRTIVMQDGKAHVQAGAGIVYDSNPEREYEECWHKAGALLKALDDAEGRQGDSPTQALGY